MKPILFNTEMVRAILDGRKTVTRRVIKIIDPDRPCLDGYKHEFVRDDFTPGYEYTGFVCKHCGYGVSSPYGKYPVGTSFIRPPYQPGDTMYVRETWCDPTVDQSGYPILYKADFPMHWDAEDTETGDPIDLRVEDYKWRPSLHMPKEAARIFLRVTDVRVERLQDMSEDDVVAEGAEALISCRNERGIINPDGTLGDMCWNTGVCKCCKYIDKSYGELFGEIVWDKTVKPSDRDRYGWSANPFVFVIEFERIK